MPLELDFQIGIIGQLQEHVHHVTGHERLPSRRRRSLCSTSTCSRNLSNLLLSIFILFT
ncbi:hypothetical protein MUK42_22284 [Musa troglodytarum]|uniref:Uncharacterized protein n=1 Tax=Musa troglodytarum TaxID=320322 RepID=A0A9E7KCI7_9LILI|nr:hypothetical protein MUK42_22284 [Musa troglodytarum]